jgi:hypothetical protein
VTVLLSSVFGVDKTALAFDPWSGLRRGELRNGICNAAKSANRKLHDSLTMTPSISATWPVACSLRCLGLAHRNHSKQARAMSTLWEMAETIRAEEAAALAAQATRRNRLRQWLAAFHAPSVTAGAELPVVRRFPITRLASRKPGPTYLP